MNTDTTGAAAAVSAIPGSSSGLAYWGGGNLQLTGSHAWKNGTLAWESTSDRRVKRDIKDYNQGMADLLKVRPVRFHYNGLGGTTDDGHEFVGVVAQELENVLPEMVGSRMEKLHPGDANAIAIKNVDPSNFVYMLINAVKEQQKTINNQEARIRMLENERGPRASSTPSVRGVELGALIGLFPVGAMVALRRQRKRR